MSCGDRRIKAGGGEIDVSSCAYELHQRLKNVTVEILRCPKCGRTSIGWYMQENTEDITEGDYNT